MIMLNWLTVSRVSRALVLLAGGLLWLASARASEPSAAPTTKPVVAKKSKAELKAEKAAVEKATPKTDVRRLQAWKDAELIASLGPGRMEVMGAGESMKPVYGENTILVINKIDFLDLSPGMNAAYTNSRGRQVVHQLIAKEGAGWRVQGLNNAHEDQDRVTRYNLIGVVYASICYGDEP